MRRLDTKRRRAGFTLIELVIVVGILVVLAGLVLPNLDNFMVKANKGAAASNMADAARAVQTSFIQSNAYANRWDSLLVTSTGALWAPGTANSTDPVDAGLDPALVGGPPAGSPTKLITYALATDLEARSLNRVGITDVLDAADAASSLPPGDRFTIIRSVSNGEKLATLNPAEPKNSVVFQKLYPIDNPPGGAGPYVTPAHKKLVILGLGPTNTLIGTTLMSTPFYPGTNPKQYYNRFLACFEIDDRGRPARLMAVLGGDADHMDGEISDYYLQ